MSLLRVSTLFLATLFVATCATAFAPVDILQAQATPAAPMVINVNVTGRYTLRIQNFMGDIDWGTGESTQHVSTATSNITHTFATTGSKTIRVGTSVGDTATGFGAGCDDMPSGGLITSVVSWGDIGNSTGFTSLEGAFSFEQDLVSVPNSFPSHVTNTSCMFDVAISFNQNINGWDVHNVTEMTSMFSSALTFNQPLNNWNVSHVLHFDWMFSGAVVFNQPLNSWNTSSAMVMEGMFTSANIFNQDISGWDTSHVYNFRDMFAGDCLVPYAFNQPLNAWNVSSATSMWEMFSCATNFNQPLNNWDVSHVSNFSSMFENASAFNQNLGAWNMTQGSNLDRMLTNSALNTTNYSALLSGWGQQSIQSNVTLGSVPAHYTTAASAGRQALVSAGWVFTDLGLEASPTPTPSPSPSNSSSTESPSLASTGFTVVPPLALGTVLFLAGMTLLLWRRRRTY